MDLTPAALRQILTNAGVTDRFDSQVMTFIIESRRLALENIAHFVQEAQTQGRDISTQALRMSYIEEEDLTTIASRLYNIEPVFFSQTDLDIDIASLITEEEARSWRALPYGRDEIGHLLVAIPDPKDLSARERIQRKLPRETIIFKFAPAKEFEQALDAVYRTDITTTLPEGTAPARMVVRAEIDPATVRTVKSFIMRAVRDDASDIHIEPHEDGDTEMRFRLDGDLRTVQKFEAGAPTDQIIACIKTMAEMKIDERYHPQDGRIAGKTIAEQAPNLRVETLPTTNGEQLHIRLLDQSRAALSLEQLGMSHDNLKRYEAAINKAHGCALITGPTGSGKSTTLYSSVQRVFDVERKFVSIEDPVEFKIEGMTQIDCSGHGGKKIEFDEALRAILRSDPDTILLGEIRDRKTAAVAIEAALSGHYLYSTLHSRDALGSVTRLRRLDIDPYLIAESVVVMVAQRLVLLLCPKCRVAQRAKIDYLKRIDAPEWAIELATKEDGLRVFRPNEGGCEYCRGRGYRGRTGIFEVVAMTDELREMISDGTTDPKEMERYVREQGMESMRGDALRKVLDGATSFAEYFRIVI